jgi:hypothetical protein
LAEERNWQATRLAFNVLSILSSNRIVPAPKFARLENCFWTKRHDRSIQKHAATMLALLATQSGEFSPLGVLVETTAEKFDVMKIRRKCTAGCTKSFTASQKVSPLHSQRSKKREDCIEKKTVLHETLDRVKFG